MVGVLGLLRLGVGVLVVGGVGGGVGGLGVRRWEVRKSRSMGTGLLGRWVGAWGEGSCCGTVGALRRLGGTRDLKVAAVMWTISGRASKKTVCVTGCGRLVW